MNYRSKITQVRETLLEYAKTEERNDLEHQILTSLNKAHLHRADNYYRLSRLLMEFLDENP